MYISRLLKSAAMVSAFLAFNLKAETLICDGSENIVDDYVVAFFNDAGKSEIESQLDLIALTRLYGDKYNGQRISYESFYNHTDSALKVETNNAGTILMGVYESKANQIDDTGTLSSRLDLFNAMVQNDPDGIVARLVDVLKQDNPTLSESISDLYSDILAAKQDKVSAISYHMADVSDYAIFSSRVATLSAQGSKLILVGHGQGNQFLNSAYEFALTQENIDNSNIGVIQIAPINSDTSSNIEMGGYVLADKDAVVNHVSDDVSKPLFTAEIPLEHLEIEATGHDLVKTYLNDNLDAYGQVKGIFNTLLDDLIAPEKLAESGAFTVTLTWTGSSDIDLHSFEPSGKQVYYSQKEGDVGYLDLDNKLKHGPEHYYATCDNANMMEGVFKFGVNNFKGGYRQFATVQLSTPTTANITTRTIQMGYEEGKEGNSSPEILIEIEVVNAENGLSISLLN